jgi:hypothetical protein
VSDEFVWARDLPPFDEAADCPKCGGGAVRTVYHLCSERGFPCGLDYGRWVLDGHLCRVCERCGHGWCEAPADVKPPRGPALRLVAALEAGSDDAVPPPSGTDPEDKEGGGG